MVLSLSLSPSLSLSLSLPLSAHIFVGERQTERILVTSEHRLESNTTGVKQQHTHTLTPTHTHIHSHSLSLSHSHTPTAHTSLMLLHSYTHSVSVCLVFKCLVENFLKERDHLALQVKVKDSFAPPTEGVHCDVSVRAN